MIKAKIIAILFCTIISAIILPGHIFPQKKIFYHNLYKLILLRKCKEDSHILMKTALNNLLEISEKINQLPIAEILNTIDMLAKELPPFLEKYEFHSKITWKAWLKKYWWVPPIFIGWFGLKVLLNLQRPYFYYSSYLLPRPQIPLQPIITNDPALLEIRKE